MKSSLDIIVPCYNPGEGWAETLQAHYQELVKQVPEVQVGIILVNDGSQKQVSEEQIEQLKNQIENFSYLSYTQNVGKGHAMRTGVQASESDYQLLTDIDFPYDLQSMIALWNSLKAGDNIALGYRESTYYEKVPFWRVVISKLFRWVLLKVLRMPIMDTQCGLKGFDKVGRQVFLQTSIKRFLYDFEFVLLSTKDKNLKIQPVPVNLRADVSFSRMNMGILFRESLNFIKVLLKR